MMEKQKGKGWIKSFLLMQILAAILTIIFVITVNRWAIINAFLSDLLGAELNAVLILILALVILPLVTGSLSYKRYYPLVQNKTLNKIPFILKALGFLLFLLQIAGLIAIFYMRMATIVFFPAIFTVAISGSLVVAALIVVSLYPVLKKGFMKYTEPRVRQMFYLKIGIVYGLLCAGPFYYWLAGDPHMLVYSLPPKPGLFAHRMGNTIAPENTMIAGEKSLAYNPVGVEVDVVLTSDGVPILLHDSTLERTTNIATVFPDRATNRVDTFTFTEILQLDAGSWFVDKDPYGSIASGLVSAAEAESYRNITIPTFAESLNFSVVNNLMIYLDLKGTWTSTPFSENYFEIVIDTVLASGIDLNKVQIEQMNAGRYKILEEKAATDIQCGINLGPLASPLIYYLAPYKADFAFSSQIYSNNALKELYWAGIPVHEWTIDDPVRFKELWLLGVTWVMTNDLHILSAINDPGEFYSPINYCLLWLGIIVVVFAEFIISVRIIKKKDPPKV